MSFEKHVFAGVGDFEVTIPFDFVSAAEVLVSYTTSGNGVFDGTLDQLLATGEVSLVEGRTYRFKASVGTEVHGVMSRFSDLTPDVRKLLRGIEEVRAELRSVLRLPDKTVLKMTAYPASKRVGKTIIFGKDGQPRIGDAPGASALEAAGIAAQEAALKAQAAEKSAAAQAAEVLSASRRIASAVSEIEKLKQDALTTAEGLLDSCKAEVLRIASNAENSAAEAQRKAVSAISGYVSQISSAAEAARKEFSDRLNAGTAELKRIVESGKSDLAERERAATEQILSELELSLKIIRECIRAYKYELSEAFDAKWAESAKAWAEKAEYWANFAEEAGKGWSGPSEELRNELAAEAKTRADADAALNHALTQAAEALAQLRAAQTISDEALKKEIAARKTGDEETLKAAAALASGVNVFARKEAVETEADLPQEGNDLFDIREVKASGESWFWNGSEWVNAGSLSGGKSIEGLVEKSGGAEMTAASPASSSNANILSTRWKISDLAGAPSAGTLRIRGISVLAGNASGSLVTTPVYAHLWKIENGTATHLAASTVPSAWSGANTWAEWTFDDLVVPADSVLDFSLSASAGAPSGTTAGTQFRAAMLAVSSGTGYGSYFGSRQRTDYSACVRLKFVLSTVLSAWGIELAQQAGLDELTAEHGTLKVLLDSHISDRDNPHKVGYGQTLALLNPFVLLPQNWAGGAIMWTNGGEGDDNQTIHEVWYPAYHSRRYGFGQRTTGLIMGSVGDDAGKIQTALNFADGIAGKTFGISVKEEGVIVYGIPLTVSDAEADGHAVNLGQHKAHAEDSIKHVTAAEKKKWNEGIVSDEERAKWNAGQSFLTLFDGEADFFAGTYEIPAQFVFQPLINVSALTATGDWLSFPENAAEILRTTSVLPFVAAENESEDSRTCVVSLEFAGKLYTANVVQIGVPRFEIDPSVFDADAIGECCAWEIENL